MKIIIESTTKIVTVDGVPCRVWQGVTDSGIKLHCYITRIAIDKNETRAEEFRAELLEQEPPRVELEAIPLRLIL